MYGLNPTITSRHNPNSPFYENPCDYCKLGFAFCEQCEFAPEQENEYTSEQKDEDLVKFEVQTEMYTELI